MNRKTLRNRKISLKPRFHVGRILSVLLLSGSISYASDWYEKGVNAYKRAHFGKAIKFLYQGIKNSENLENDEYQAFMYLGASYQAIGETEKAEETYLRLLSVNPKFDCGEGFSPKVVQLFRKVKEKYGKEILFRSCPDSAEIYLKTQYGEVVLGMIAGELRVRLYDFPGEGRYKFVIYRKKNFKSDTVVLNLNEKTEYVGYLEPRNFNTGGKKGLLVVKFSDEVPFEIGGYFSGKGKAYKGYLPVGGYVVRALGYPVYKDEFKEICVKPGENYLKVGLYETEGFKDFRNKRKAAKYAKAFGAFIGGAVMALVSFAAYREAVNDPVRTERSKKYFVAFYCGLWTIIDFNIGIHLLRGQRAYIDDYIDRFKEIHSDSLIRW